jgi:hypothetical protein
MLKAPNDQSLPFEMGNESLSHHRNILDGADEHFDCLFTKRQFGMSGPGQKIHYFKC